MKTIVFLADIDYVVRLLSNYELQKPWSSRPEVFCKKGVLRNFTKFTGKHLCQSLLFNKVAGPRPATLLKKRLWHRCFPVNFAKFLRTPFLTEHLRWLLLNFEGWHLILVAYKKISVHSPTHTRTYTLHSQKHVCRTIAAFKAFNSNTWME